MGQDAHTFAFAKLGQFQHRTRNFQKVSPQARPRPCIACRPKPKPALKVARLLVWFCSARCAVTWPSKRPPKDTQLSAWVRLCIPVHTSQYLHSYARTCRCALRTQRYEGYASFSRFAPLIRRVRARRASETASHDTHHARRPRAACGERRRARQAGGKRAPPRLLPLVDQNGPKTPPKRMQLF